MGQAGEFLRRSRNHLERVRDAAPDPTDWFDLTIYGFYCVEAAVMAAASSVGIAVDTDASRESRGLKEPCSQLWIA